MDVVPGPSSSKQAFPRNPQSTLAREAWSLSANLHLTDYLYSKSKVLPLLQILIPISVGNSLLQPPLLSAPISSRKLRSPLTFFSTLIMPPPNSSRHAL